METMRRLLDGIWPTLEATADGEPTHSRSLSGVHASANFSPGQTFKELTWLLTPLSASIVQAR